MRGDGNCLFRFDLLFVFMFSALADQLYGDASRHPETRRETVEFMEANHQDFSPFVVDTTFPKYRKFSPS